MEVILREDFPSLGYVGDRVNVKRGYARNFLIPRGIALDASVRNVRLLNHQLSAVHAKRAKLRADAEELAKKIAEIQLAFTLKMGKHGKSFGSVTLKEVLSQLAEKGVEVDRKRVKMSEAFKRPGKYTVEIKLHAEVTVPVTVEVSGDKIEEDSEAPEGKKTAADEDGAPRKRGRGKTRAPRTKAKAAAAQSEEAETGHSKESGAGEEE